MFKKLRKVVDKAICMHIEVIDNIPVELLRKLLQGEERIDELEEQNKTLLETITFTRDQIERLQKEVLEKRNIESQCFRAQSDILILQEQIVSNRKGLRYDEMV